MKDYYDLIEDYLNGELPIEGRVEFEEALQKDPELNKLLHQYQDLYYRLEAAAMRKKVQSALTDVDININNTKTFSNQINYIAFVRSHILKLAALVIITVSLFFYFIKNHNTEKKNEVITNQQQSIDSNIISNIEASNKDSVAIQDPKQTNQKPIKSIFKEKPKDYYFALVERNRDKLNFGNLRASSSTPDDSFRLSVYTAYQSEKYNDVISKLRNIEKENAQLLFIRANAFMSLKNYKSALQDFNLLNQNDQYKFDAQWNIVLCYLGIQNMEMYNKLLKDILQLEDHPFYDKARLLISELNISEAQ